MSITLRKKKLSKGRFSLFLDICVDGSRKKEYLNIYLEKPVNNNIREENKLKWGMAKDIELERIAQLRHSRNSVVSRTTAETESESVDFFVRYDAFMNSYSRRDIRVVIATFTYLKRFVGRNYLFTNEIDRRFCEDFLIYLFQSLRGNTPIGYFKKFKMCLEKCVEDGLYPNNPANKVRMAMSNELSKDILSSSEIQQLAETPLSSSEVKRAFLFACCTGLRWCDIKVLKYQSIDYERGMITVAQQKVLSRSSMAVVHLNMNSTATNLLKMRSGNNDDLVFDLPSYSYARRLLLKWAEQAGINKHVTFHVGRHSFITNLILGGADIKTASLLAGHSTIRHTEKYVHIVNEQKQKAVDALPKIDLGDWGENIEGR